jgi:hypothetical protein
MTVNLDGSGCGPMGCGKRSRALQVCRNTPGPSKRPGHESGRFVVDLRFSPFHPSGRSTSGLKFVCASRKSRRGTPRAQLARQMIRFKTRFARGETRRNFRDFKPVAPRGGSPRAPQFAGQWQTKADRSGPTKPGLHPKFKTGEFDRPQRSPAPRCEPTVNTPINTCLNRR